jgi:hypothetical protein
MVHVVAPKESSSLTDFKNVEIPYDSLRILLGEFNFVRSTENRNNPGGNRNDMMLYNLTISGHALFELSLKGRQFTSSNMQEAPVLEQLD